MYRRSTADKRFALHCVASHSCNHILITCYAVTHAGPGAALPNFAAKAGIKVLGSKPLRMLANKLAYFDKKQFATEDAMRIGRYVCACM
jgi:hypothetical protein